MAQTKSLKRTIQDLQPGESLVLGPGQREQTARTYCSDLAFTYLRRYSVNRNRETRIVTVTRTQ